MYGNIWPLIGDKKVAMKCQKRIGINSILKMLHLTKRKSLDAWTYNAYSRQSP
jgi:hypothetical protein